MRGNLKLLPAIFSMLAYLFNAVSNQHIKERLLTRFYQDWSIAKLQLAASAYAREYLPKLINPAALERLHWHRQQGHQIYVVSANLEIYLKPWAAQMGIEHLLATRLVVLEEKITGKIQGKCCYGPEKLARLQTLLGSLQDYCLFVYGDSRSDREILAVADHPYYRLFTANRGLWIH